MAFLDKAALLGEAARTVPIEKLDIPELGGFVYVKGSTGKERDFFESKVIRTPKGELRDNTRARAAIHCVCDEHGTRLFSDDDMRLVGELRADILQRIFNAFQKVNGMSDADVKELGEVSDDPAAGTGSSLS